MKISYDTWRQAKMKKATPTTEKQTGKDLPTA